MTRARPLHAPSPYDDESVSSWLTRLAALHRLSLSEMTIQMGLQSPDPDLALVPEDVVRLEELTRQPADVVRALQLGADFPQADSLDLIERDSETGVRAQFCSKCLSEDISHGRDHYVRREWLLTWTSACTKHVHPLQELSSVDVVPRHRGQKADRAIRFARPLDDTINPFRVRSQGEGGSTRVCSQVGLFSADIMDALRLGGSMDNWDCAGDWDAARTALLALSDLLVCRAWSDGPPLYAVLLGPDTPVRLWLGAPGRHVLPRLSTPGRRVILEALSCLLMDPQRFFTIGLHSGGANGFYGTFRTVSTRFHGPLSRVAILDPLAAVLALAPPLVVREAISNSQSWPPRLQVRLGHASAVALAAM